MSRTAAGRATAEVWRERVAEWQRSGATARDFAEKLGVSRHSLTWWKWKLAGGGARTPRSRACVRSPSFVPVVLEAARPRDGSGVEVIAGGRTVRVIPGFDAESFTRVVALLESA